ncbi:MAG: hypothetical protein OES79_00990 [Planctomycetota bacterium]|nr:hypothetical protein [Planctomycetota bacterium]
MTRPTSADQPIELDLMWGNRLDGGFMTKQDHGLLFELIHIDGPNVVTVDNTDPLNPNINGIENSFDMVSVDLMKMWRLTPFHHGSILEHFAGD